MNGAERRPRSGLRTVLRSGSIPARRNFAGTPIEDTFTVGAAPTASSYGTPPFMFDPAGEDRFGCSLDHRVSRGVTERAVNLGVHDSGAGHGYFVTAVVNFDTLAGLNGTQAIVNSSEAGGFASSSPATERPPSCASGCTWAAPTATTPTT